ncbi:hypothetical protein [Sorangium sp. So ce117]|uniref:hypothetical protein n=1 Tax=Sorangium sp. So ce117 TaxID=3133277 RepID=UPI003F6179CF
MTSPPAASASNTFVLSASSPKCKQTSVLLSFAAGVPGIVSLTRMTPGPMCSVAWMIRSLLSGDGLSPGTSPKRITPSHFAPSALS